MTVRERALFDAPWAGRGSAALAGSQATHRIVGVLAGNRLGTNDMRAGQVLAEVGSGRERHSTVHANRFCPVADRGAVPFGMRA